MIGAYSRVYSLSLRKTGSSMVIIIMIHHLGFTLSELNFLSHIVSSHQHIIIITVFQSPHSHSLQNQAFKILDGICMYNWPITVVYLGSTRTSKPVYIWNKCWHITGVGNYPSHANQNIFAYFNAALVEGACFHCSGLFSIPCHISPAAICPSSKSLVPYRTAWRGQCENHPRE